MTDHRHYECSCTPDDFADLCEQARSLPSVDEARRLLLDCARVGGPVECDSILALLRTFGGGGGGSHSDPDPDDDPDDGGGGTTTTATRSFVDVVDGGGNTALHRACANGHDAAARLLVENGGASLLSNGSGNTPLHWAAAGGHGGCVRVLLRGFPSSRNGGGGGDGDGDGGGGGVGVIDVLEKNDFGRSALTEGFSSQNTEVVGMLLEHDSATEERLIGGVRKEDVSAGVGDDEDRGEGGSEGDGRRESGDSRPDSGMTAAARRRYEEAAGDGVVHEFDFRRTTADDAGGDDGDNDRGDDEENETPSVLIRELPIANADDPFGYGGDAAGDTTGFGIWAASLVLARWVASDEVSSRFGGKTVLELGAGCGVPGIAAARYSNASAVYVTDLNPATVENLRYNVDLNAGGGTDKDDEDGGRPWMERVRALPIDWADESTWPTSDEEKMDFVIGSDLIYQGDVVPLLRRVVNGLLREDGGVFLYVAPDDGHRDGLAEFVREMKGESDGDAGYGGSYRCSSQRVAPDEYRANPLRSGDEDDCFLHFHELGSTAYVLYEFRRGACR